MELTGQIKRLGETQQVTDSFRKREIVIHTDEQYPQDVSVQFVQDKCDILDNYMEGEDVEVSINIRGREWVSPDGDVKYFNTIQGWKIVKTDEDPFAQK